MQEHKWHPCRAPYNDRQLPVEVRTWSSHIWSAGGSRGCACWELCHVCSKSSRKLPVLWSMVYSLYPS